MTTCVVDSGTTVSWSAGLRKSAPTVAPTKHPAASTALSRPVRGPIGAGCNRSPGAISDAGLTSSTHNLRAPDMTPA